MSEKPVKKVGTRKTPSGAQQYTSPKFARELSASPTTRKVKDVKVARAMGRASADAFDQYGARDKKVKVSSSYGAKKRVGKPRGGR